MRQLYITCTLFLFIVTKAFATPQLTAFSVWPDYLQNGRIKVYNNGSTPFVAMISATRAINGTTWENVTMELVFYAQIGNVEHVLKTITLSSSDFDGEFLKFYNEHPQRITAANNKVNISIPQNVERSDIRVKYRHKDANNNWVPNTTYGYNTFNTFFQTINLGAPYPPQFSPVAILKLQAMGFSTDGITNFNDQYYLVDEDLLINKNALENTGPYSNVVSNVYSHNINILIDESIWSSANWYSGVNTAIEVWNSTPGCNVKLNLISTSYSYAQSPRVDITIKGDNGVLGSGLAAVTEYPKGDGMPGSLILVNSDFKDPNTNNFINSAQTAWRLLHQIGHCLGLKNNSAQSYPGSVMNRSTLGTLTYPISQSSYDVTAINTLYPLNANDLVASYISGPSSVARFGQDNFSLSYMSLENGVNYQWKVIGINGTNYNYDHGESSPGLAEMAFSVAGNYQIQCTLSGGKYLVPVTTTKNIIVQ